MKKLCWFLLVFAVAILVVGCSEKKDSGKEDAVTTDKGTEGTSEDGKEEEKKERVELKVALNAQPPTMDPLMTTAVVTRDLTRHVYETLIVLNENFEVQTMLAESYDVSEDGKTITFKLRKDIKFHNGDLMTVDDVVASMDRWKEVSSLGRAYFSNATFSSEGDDTVILELEERLYTALSILANPGVAAVITPKSIIDNATAEGMTEFIGTGPFKFEEWKSDQYIHLTKFEDYQSLDTPASGLSGKKEAKVDDIYFEFVIDASTRFAGMQTGEYDIANAIPFDNAEQLEQNDEVRNSIDHNGFNAVVFNKKQGLFENKIARQAINAALDEDAILTAAFSNENFYELEHGLMIKDQVEWYSEVGKDLYNQKDPDKAKELLKEAGYNGEEIVILSTRDYQDHYNAAVTVHQQLVDLGMNAKLDIYEWATVLERRSDENAYDIFITGFPTEPIPAGYVFLDSRNDWPGWTNNPKMDDLLDSINKATSEEEAKQFFDELQAEFYDYLPIIKFGNKTTITTTRANIEGMDFLHGFILWNVEKK